MTDARRTALFVAIVVPPWRWPAAYLRSGRAKACHRAGAGPLAAPIAVSLPAAQSTVLPVSLDQAGSLLRRARLHDPDRTAPLVPIPNLRCQRVHMAGGTRRVPRRTRRHRVPCAAVRRQLQGVRGAAAGWSCRAGFRWLRTAGWLRRPSSSAAIPTPMRAFRPRPAIIDLTTGAGWSRTSRRSPFIVARAIVRSIDFNFWGVTFMRDGRNFYATLGTAAERLLVRGNVDTRQVEVIEDNVECPSLSPDNRRVAFKQRSRRGGPVTWEIWVLDLETRKRHRLAETHSIDDQLQWLDDTGAVVRQAIDLGPGVHRPMDRGGRRLGPTLTISGGCLFGDARRPGRWGEADEARWSGLRA